MSPHPESSHNKRMIELHRANTIGTAATPRDLFLVASSFEPRSIRATSLVDSAAFDRAVIFNYEDTLDTIIGQYNATQIRTHLAARDIGRIDVLPCTFSDPYSAIAVFDAFASLEGLRNSVRSVTIDTTCFTKIHLLLLLQYLEDSLGVTDLDICYTEPLSYATDFGKQLSYGVDRTLYLPYQPASHSSKGIGLIAFLGHERLRVERIIQDLEPDVAVVIFGEPGFTQNMQDYSRRVNDSLIHRATYDQQYRLASASTKDIGAATTVLQDQIELLVRRDGCDSVYLAALGTKLQALSIDVIRRQEMPVRLLLAYTVPKRYERAMYSQGSGPTYSATLW